MVEVAISVKDIELVEDIINLLRDEIARDGEHYKVMKEKLVVIFNKYDIEFEGRNDGK